MPNNILLLAVDDPDEANHNNAGASAGVPIRFVTGNSVVAEAPNQNEDPYTPPYIAGHGIKQWPCGTFACNWGGYCTMGFAAKLPDGVNDGAFTAGHCTDPNDYYISHNDHYPVYIGKPAGSVLANSGDVDFYAYSAVAGRTTAPKAFMNWPTTIKVIATDTGHEQVGYTRIKNGRMLGYGNGILRYTNVDIDGAGSLYTCCWRAATYSSTGGDSGMPVWHPLNGYAWASGIHRGRGDINGVSLAVYGHINNVLLASGYSLKTTL